MGLNRPIRGNIVADPEKSEKTDVASCGGVGLRARGASPQASKQRIGSIALFSPVILETWSGGTPAAKAPTQLKVLP